MSYNRLANKPIYRSIESLLSKGLLDSSSLTQEYLGLVLRDLKQPRKNSYMKILERLPILEYRIRNVLVCNDVFKK